ncbi:MFS transporter [Nonomuraea turcica]|uniref:MFS transporter n=1 Tax=Nonomuraea sp. G32 TaxID=3067274 RepID=UPI00273B2EA3|nr:MFS transporter [Nonomuraea sp. G32]MDP4503728.1 MFS transporter [Nonomuraea sp. G32]
MFPIQLEEKTRGWLAVLAVTLGIFSLMTSELLPVGLLTPIGEALDVSAGTAGLMVTVPGLVAGLTAPLLTVRGAAVDRRLMLAWLVGLMAAANLICALAPHFAVVLAARVVIGVSVGGFSAIAGGLAARLVPPQQAGAATAVIFGGVSTASVLGVPAGTLIGEVAGWRGGFAAVGVLGLTALAGLLLLVPRLPSQKTINFADLSALLRTNMGVRVGVVVTVLLISGHFAAYTFVRPLLHDLAGLDDSLIGAVLMLYGLAGIAGNFVAGHRVSRQLSGTLLLIAATLAAATALFALAAAGPLTGTVLLVVWGLAYGGVSVTLQTWMLRAAPDMTESASSLFVAAFNLSIAFGALVGGLTADQSATVGVLWVACGLTLVAALTVAVRNKQTL